MKVRVISGLNEADYNRQFPSNPYALGAVGMGAPNQVARGFLALPRGAFLTLVHLNIVGIATALKRKAQSNRGELLKKWEQVGGKYSELEKAFNKGAAKKPILRNLGQRIGIGSVQNNNSIGAAGAGLASVTAFIATASPIIFAIIPIIKSFIPPAQDFDMNYVPDEEEIEKAETSAKSSFNTNMLLTAGLIAGGLFFLSQNMRRR